MSILAYDEKKVITPYRAGQLLDLAGDIARRITVSKYGYLNWDEVTIVLDTIRIHFEQAHEKGEI